MDLFYFPNYILRQKTLCRFTRFAEGICTTSVLLVFQWFLDVLCPLLHPDRLRRASSSGQRSCLQTQLDDNQLCDRAPLPARIREGRPLREGVPRGRVLVGSGALMSETQARPNHFQVYTTFTRARRPNMGINTVLGC